jgi:hypothetical protein
MKGGHMTLKEIKNKIYAILDVDITLSEGSVYSRVEGYIPYILDSSMKKVALNARCIKKSAALSFSSENGKMSALLPDDFASFCYVRSGRVYGRECFEIISGKIRTQAFGTGQAELVYVAFPETIDTSTKDETEISLPEDVILAVCYCAAMEICTNIYPSDVQRYMRIATEYDERMASLITSASEGNIIANSFFSRARGVFF